MRLIKSKRRARHWCLMLVILATAGRDQEDGVLKPVLGK
jgi:hypothetical protein